jgi:hypothetical protein
MSENQRTAVDVLLSLETKIDQLTYLNRNLELNNKVLSNKITHIMGLLSSLSIEQKTIAKEAYDPIGIATSPPALLPEFAPPPSRQQHQIEDEVTFPQEVTPSVETAPVGFRRTSRPETYTQNQAPQKKNVPTPSIPQGDFKPPTKIIQNERDASARVPLSQQIIDNKGQKMFLSSVEIVNVETGTTEAKTRTNGVGKWTASLPYGRYRVKIRKQEGLGKQGEEYTQELIVNGKTPQDLPPVILGKIGAK